VEWHQTFFEVADDEHPAAKIQQRLARDFGQHDAFDLFKTAGFVNVGFTTLTDLEVGTICQGKGYLSRRHYDSPPITLIFTAFFEPCFVIDGFRAE
jgi:hypothetical protein